MSLVAWLLLELCCHLRFDESIGDDDHAAFTKQMFKLKCKFSPTPGIWIIFQRTFVQRLMRTPDQIEKTIEFEIHSVKIVGFENNNVLIYFLVLFVVSYAFICTHYTKTGNGTGDQWVVYLFSRSQFWSQTVPTTSPVQCV